MLPAYRPSEGRTQPFFTPYRLLALGILLLSGLIYLPSLTGNPIWDDKGLLLGRGVLSAHSLRECFTVPLIGTTYFRPVVAISFYIDRALFSGLAFFAHQENILLHVLTTGCLMGLIRTAFSSRRMALLGGLLFALQPAQIMNVAWIGGRTDAFCALWFALFAWALIGAIRSQGRRRLLLQTGALLAYTLLLFTREQTAFALLLVPLAYRAFGDDLRMRLWPTLPYVAVLIAYIALWLTLIPPTGAIIPQRSAGETLGAVLCSLTYYALLIVLPIPRVLYTFSLDSFAGPGWVLFGAILLLSGLALLARCWKQQAPISWFLLAMVLLLLPVLNLIALPIFPLAAYRADTAALCAAVLLAWAAFRLPVPRPLRLSLAGGLAIWYCGLTFWGAHQWQNGSQFFGAVAHYDPAYLVMRRNLAAEMEEKGRHAEAKATLIALLTDLFGPTAWRTETGLRRSLDRSPELRARLARNTDPTAPRDQWLSGLYARLGFLLRRENRTEEADRMFALALALHSMSWDGNFGTALQAMDRQDWKTAKRCLYLMQAKAPESPISHVYLGDVAKAQGDWKTAEKEYLQAVRLFPRSAAGYLTLATAQLHNGKREDARRSLLTALGCPFCDTATVRKRLASL